MTLVVRLNQVQPVQDKRSALQIGLRHVPPSLAFLGGAGPDVVIDRRYQLSITRPSIDDRSLCEPFNVHLLTSINREPPRQRMHLGLHGLFHRCVPSLAVLRETIQNLGDEFTHALELGDAEAARCCGRGAEPDA
jgi:hypothetical protein